MTILRTLIAVLLGILVGGTVVGVVEALGHVLYPLPADVDQTDFEAMAAAFRDAPLGAKAAVLVAYAAGTFTGTVLAGFVAPRRYQFPCGVAVAFALLAAYGTDRVDACLPSSAAKQHQHLAVHTTAAAAWALERFLESGAVHADDLRQMAESLTGSGAQIDDVGTALAATLERLAFPMQ